MYANPAVQENIDLLKQRGMLFIEPEEGMLACGDVGKGRLASIDVIFDRIVATLSPPRDLEGIRLMVTAGPTHERIDPVRYITNPSTGKMGYALAEAARDRGADVVLVSGPTSLPQPDGVETIAVKTAAEMAKAALAKARRCKVIIGAAAVADFTPAKVSDHKVKKKGTGMTIRLEPTIDIIAEIGKHKGRKILVGFSVETQNLIENSTKKLQKKNLDMIVCNDVTQVGAGFATDTNIVTILDRQGGSEQLPQMTKAETAHKILDRILRLL
jgi:phosphopantothenoylcysteine decarboxylase/phosphopantothenate--cysteine ligase